MFAADVAPKAYLHPARPGRGFGRVLLLVAGLVVVSAQLAYGSSPAHYDWVVVAQGDTLWSIAQARYAGDPRPRIDQIMRINHLASPTLLPGETLRVPVD